MSDPRCPCPISPPNDPSRSGVCIEASGQDYGCLILSPSRMNPRGNPARYRHRVTQGHGSPSPTTCSAFCVGVARVWHEPRGNGPEGDHKSPFTCDRGNSPSNAAPAFQAGHAGSIPVARSKFSARSPPTAPATEARHGVVVGRQSPSAALSAAPMLGSTVQSSGARWCSAAQETASAWLPATSRSSAPRRSWVR